MLSKQLQEERAGAKERAAAPTDKELQLAAQLEELKQQQLLDLQRQLEAETAKGESSAAATALQEQLDLMRAELRREQLFAAQADEAARKAKEAADEEARRRAEEGQRANEERKELIAKSQDAQALREQLEALKKRTMVLDRRKSDAGDLEAMKKELERRRLENEALRQNLEGMEPTERVVEVTREVTPSDLASELEKLREENRKLKLARGEMLDPEDDSAFFDSYIAKLSEMLKARHTGVTPPGLYDAYMESLVQLSDDYMREMYINFTLIYMGEHTAEVLERCRIPEVTEKVLGFCEMATIKIGEYMDQPRNVRMQALKATKKRQEEGAQRAKQQGEKEKQKAARDEKIRKAGAKAYQDLQPQMEKLARGEGDSSAAKRFGRRQELQLLVMSPADMKVKFSDYQWKQLMTSGLQQPEVRAIHYALRQVRPAPPCEGEPCKRSVPSRLALFKSHKRPEAACSRLRGAAYTHARAQYTWTPNELRAPHTARCLAAGWRARPGPTLQGYCGGTRPVLRRSYPGRDGRGPWTRRYQPGSVQILRSVWGASTAAAPAAPAAAIAFG